MPDIHKVAALVIRKRKLLVVHKKGYDFYISLGGRIEKGETELQCLERECIEESGCRPIKPNHFASFDGKTVEGYPIHMSCYLCELDGEPKLNPKDTIDGFAWVDRNYFEKKYRLAPILEEQVIPELIKKGLL